MNDFDHSDLDGRALQLFLAVLEEGSVTAAATRLGLTQSAVSHGLARLRRIVQDPLFTKSGRGIVPTAHALALAGQARDLLDGMRRFASSAPFDPATARLSVTIAANDFQRDLLLPALFRNLEAAARLVSLRIVPSGLPSASMLREGRCDLLITPLPPVAADVIQKSLFQDHYVCYFDPRARAAPRTVEDYLAARHVTVVYTDNERLDFDKRLAARGIARDIAISVPNFAAAAAFLRGSTLLASMPSLLGGGVMQEFAAVPVPLADGPGSGIADLPMYLVWHRRHQADPAHAWLRRLVEEGAAAVRRQLSPADGAAPG